MKSPKISIVIPSYNKVKYIDQTLKSIFDQSYKNFEVIIQDGGSTDGSLEIIKKYVKKYSKKIKFESKKDKGQLGAINKGLNKVSGDIISFINADDVYEINAFDLVVKYYIMYPNTIWFAGKGTVIDNNNNEIVKLVTYYKNFLQGLNSNFCLLVINYLMQPSIFLNRKAYLKYGPFTGTKNFVMEYDLWLKLSRIQMPILINKNLSKFRIEIDTKTKTMYQKIIKEDEKVIKKYTNNIFVIFIHKFHNLGRKILGKCL